MLNKEELKRLFALAKKKDKAGAKLIEEVARKDLRQFLEFFRKDYCDLIDWSKETELIDDELCYYVSPTDLKKKESFYILIRAFNKKGEPFRFIINTIVDLKRGQIQVGVADLPDEDTYLDDEEEDDDGEDILAMFAEKFTEQLKLGNVKPLDDSPNCSRCGRSDLPLAITVEARSMKSEKICSVCMNSGGPQNRPNKQKTVRELDEEIAEYEDLAKSYEQLIKDNPQPDSLSEGFSKFAMTPLSNYRSILAVLADLKSERMKAMTSMEEVTRLEYELKKALKAEDYKASAELRDKLDKLKK